MNDRIIPPNRPRQSYAGRGVRSFQVRIVVAIYYFVYRMHTTEEHQRNQSAHTKGVHTGFIQIHTRKGSRNPKMKLDGKALVDTRSVTIDLPANAVPTREVAL